MYKADHPPARCESWIAIATCGRVERRCRSASSAVARPRRLATRERRVPDRRHLRRVKQTATDARFRRDSRVFDRPGGFTGGMCAGCVQIIMPNPATEHCDLQRFSVPAYFSAGSSAGPARNRRSFAPSLATKSAELQAILAGATGLEPATSGVTGVRKQFQRVSPSRRNRVTVRLLRVATLPGLPQFFVWFHPVVSMTFPD